jgi:hypothetical protein
VKPTAVRVDESKELLTRMHELLDDYDGEECVAVMMWLLGLMGAGVVDAGETTKEEIMRHFVSGISAALDINLALEKPDGTCH